MADIITTLTGQKPDIKQTFSLEIEQNYRFLFDIIWNDKLRVSRTSFKFESNIIESRIYHVIYPKKSHDESHDLPPLTWSILKIKLVCKKFFLEQYLKWRCWINQALQNWKDFRVSSGLTWFFKSEPPG